MLNRRFDSSKTISIISALLVLSGCSSVEVQSQSFRVAPNSQVESAQIAIDADFSQYDRLRASELGIYFPQSYLTTAEDIAHIRQIFRDAFLAQLDTYSIVQEPGPTTMKVEASIIDMRTSVGDQLPRLRSDIRDMAKPGTIVFLMEMRDSMTDKVLARAADSARAPAFASDDGVETDWASIEEAAQHWAALFRTFLDENLAR